MSYHPNQRYGVNYQTHNYVTKSGGTTVNGGATRSPVPVPMTSERTIPSKSVKYYSEIMAASSASTVAIDNKIEQAMDLVKSHLMFAVREEVEVLKERIVELMDKITNLECENTLLRQYASPDALHQVKQTQSQGGVQPPLPHHTSS